MEDQFLLQMVAVYTLGGLAYATYKIHKASKYFGNLASDGNDIISKAQNLVKEDKKSWTSMRDNFRDIRKINQDIQKSYAKQNRTLEQEIQNVNK